MKITREIIKLANECDQTLYDKREEINKEIKDYLLSKEGCTFNHINRVIHEKLMDAFWAISDELKKFEENNTG